MGPKKAAVPERKIEVTLPYRIPVHVDLPAEGHKKWLLMLNEVEKLIIADDDLQKKAAKGLRLKERKLPMEVLGRMYAQYCTLLNRLYDAYLNSVHLQRAPYMLDIISICMKRLYELRNELVHYIVNDYIYVDTPLTQLRLTPYDIQIVVPYHFAVDSRPGSVEEMLQKMWLKAYKRKHRKPRKPKPVPESSQKNLLDDPEMDITVLAPVSTTENADPSAVDIEVEEEEEEEEESESEHSEHTILSDDYIQALLIQRHERYRFYYMVAYRDICANRLLYFAPKIEPAPQAVRDRAAAYIQKVYRKFMRLKRKMLLDEKRDILLGLIPDVDLRPRNYEEERNKLYDRRRNEREKIRPRFLEQIEKENKKLLFLNKGEQIEDITVSVMEWFAEWYYGYGFFPRYPHELEGGTMIAMTGVFPTVDEQKAEDERIKNLTKGKTKEMLKQERQQAKLEAKMKAELAEEARKKEKIALFKARCNPDSDPGYDPKMSEHMDAAKETLMKYRQTWSIYDEFPPKECADIVYGFINSVITEDLMHQIHIDARKFVDELMRLELKLFIKAQQTMFQRVGWKFPKTKPKRPPPAPPIPKPFIVDRKLLKNIEPLFDLGIVTKPTAKLGYIVGDLNFAACELNVLDPDVKYPPPGYGDVVRRLVLSCVFGSGIEPGANRNRAVLLVGQPRNGKSFLVDCIAGEMNAVKIDISPENFSAEISKAGKMLNYVFNAARVFQPSIIFCKNIEKVFYKKVPPKEKHEKAKTMKKPLSKLVKAIPITEKVIFIATCSVPFLAQIRPMVSLFDEVILVPRTDYGSLQRFFYDRLQSIRSIPRDYNVHGLAKVMQGVGFGVVMEMVDKVLTAERICRLNVTPLLQSEFLEYLIANDIEPMLMSEYKKYEEFYMKNSVLKKEREEYDIINFVRADAYKKLAKKKEEDEKKAEAKRLAKSA